MRRLIRRWTVFPATCQISTLRITLGTASYGQLAGSGTFRERMSLHLPGLRRTLHALHLRSRWHLPRRKLGRRQDLGYLEEGC
jgi:hypothetical protein